MLKLFNGGLPGRRLLGAARSLHCLPGRWLTWSQRYSAKTSVGTSQVEVSSCHISYIFQRYLRIFAQREGRSDLPGAYRVRVMHGTSFGRLLLDHSASLQSLGLGFDGASVRLELGAVPVDGRIELLANIEGKIAGEIVMLARCVCFMFSISNSSMFQRVNPHFSPLQFVCFC